MAQAPENTVSPTIQPRAGYEIHADGDLAGIEDYTTSGDVVSFNHTEIYPAFEGFGLAAILVRQALDDLRARGLKVHPVCPYVVKSSRQAPRVPGPDQLRSRSSRGFVKFTEPTSSDPASVAVGSLLSGSTTGSGSTMRSAFRTAQTVTSSTKPVNGQPMPIRATASHPVWSVS